MILQDGLIIRSRNRADNLLLTLGTDKDIVFVLNTAGLVADEELTGVIEGTSDHQGSAANSLIISNTATDGDILGLVSDAGNSKEWIRVLAATPNLELGFGMTAVEINAGGLTGNAVPHFAASGGLSRITNLFDIWGRSASGGGGVVNIFSRQTSAGAVALNLETGNAANVETIRLSITGAEDSATIDFLPDGTSRLKYAQGTFAFQEATAITVPAAADLTLGDDVVLLTIKGDGTVDVNATSLDLLGSATLLNVGAAGNNWTADTFTLAGGAGQQKMTLQTTSTSNNAELNIIGAASSTAYMMTRFTQGDGSGDANNMAYDLGYDASAGYFKLTSEDTDGASARGDILRIPDGQLTVDGNSTFDDTAFDEYDDAMVLSPYRNGELNFGIRKEELIQMGVLRRYSDGWVGYNDQRMAALLAGGIYQTRWALDDMATRHEARLAVLEAENIVLKAHIEVLGGKV
ncbi:MAG: hypothetical protein J3T61_00825 [Candidatus Brocadiales bacterium]|nr:hypothetical protein [Candidatus Bathyanammoxibius sp.]